MKANKVSDEMDAWLEAHPPKIVWQKGRHGIKHHVLIEEIPLSTPGTHRPPKPCKEAS